MVDAEHLETQIDSVFVAHFARHLLALVHLANACADGALAACCLRIAMGRGLPVHPPSFDYTLESFAFRACLYIHLLAWDLMVRIQFCQMRQ